MPGVELPQLEASCILCLLKDDGKHLGKAIQSWIMEQSTDVPTMLRSSFVSALLSHPMAARNVIRRAGVGGKHFPSGAGRTSYFMENTP